MIKQIIPCDEIERRITDAAMHLQHAKSEVARRAARIELDRLKQQRPRGTR